MYVIFNLLIIILIQETQDGCKSFKELDLIRQSLKMDSPPANVSTQMYFNCLEQKVSIVCIIT